MKIYKLDEKIVSKISAGEVIESPASCVKELVENSIDAGADKITIKIQKGGLKYIMVKDNGEGMREEDLLLALERFTTSKIKKWEDLLSLKTLGFRGEALYNLKSISKLKITSKTQDTPLATKIEVFGGQIISQEKLPYSKGTCVEVFDLFFNTPQRKKFLSNQFIETKKIIDVVLSYILAFPEISFELFVDNEPLYLVEKSSDLRERISKIYGENWLNDQIEIKRDFRDELSMWGLISKPDKLPPIPQVQFLFVNKRRIRDEKIKRVLIHAYEKVKDKTPEFILFLTVRPDLIDVNVHPQKVEIRFSQDLKIYEKIYTTVKEFLYFKKQGITTLAPKSHHFLLEEINNITQILDTYLVVSIPNEGLLIIDQHVAHERLIYEKFRNREVKTKYLLFPNIISLRENQILTLKGNEDALRDIGFDFEIISKREIVIKGIPDTLEDITKEDILEIIDHLDKKNIGELDRIQDLYRKLACRSAIKKGVRLKEDEMKLLIENMKDLENPYYCPHGRPVFVLISERELEKLFMRK